MKVSMKNWRQNRMKQFWLHTLLRTYSSVMMIIIASFAILLSYADWDSREKEAQRVAQRVTTRTVEEVEYYYRESAQLAQDLVANQDRIQGVYKYFSLSTSEYFLLAVGASSSFRQLLFLCMKISMTSYVLE